LVGVGHGFGLGVLDEPLRLERPTGAQRDHGLQLREREAVGLVLGVGDRGVDRQ
jgi:hypothetical protein